MEIPESEFKTFIYTYDLPSLLILEQIVNATGGANIYTLLKETRNVSENWMRTIEAARSRFKKKVHIYEYDRVSRWSMYLNTHHYDTFKAAYILPTTSQIKRVVDIANGCCLTRRYIEEEDDAAKRQRKSDLIWAKKKCVLPFGSVYHLAMALVYLQKSARDVRNVEATPEHPAIKWEGRELLIAAMSNAFRECTPWEHNNMMEVMDNFPNVTAWQEACDMPIRRVQRLEIAMDKTFISAMSTAQYRTCDGNGRTLTEPKYMKPMLEEELDFLLKPFDPDAIPERWADVLELYPAPKPKVKVEEPTRRSRRIQDQM